MENTRKRKKQINRKMEKLKLGSVEESGKCGNEM